MDAAISGLCLKVCLKVWWEGQLNFSVECFGLDVFICLVNDFYANFAIHRFGLYAAEDLSEVDFAINGMCVDCAMRAGHSYAAIHGIAFGTACGW